MLAVTAAVVAAWVVTGASALRAVDVTWADPVECSGTRVGPTREADAEIVLSPGMRCDVVVSVRNTGWVPVDVGDLTAPFLGSEGGPGVQLEAPGES